MKDFIISLLSEMDAFDYRFLDELISIGGVDVLVALWSLAEYQEKKGIEIKEYLTSSLPRLTSNFGLPSAATFRDFIDAYDEREYTRLCPGDPNHCLVFFAERGDWRNMHRALKKGATKLNWALDRAAERGQLSIVRYLMEEKRATGFSVLCAAAFGGHFPVIKYLVEERGEADFAKAYCSAAAGGHLLVMEYFEGKGVDDFAEGLIMAAECDQLHIVRYFIEEKDATNLKDALYSALYHGAINVAKYLIEEKGLQCTRRLTKILKESAQNGHLNVIKYFVEKGAQNLQSVLCTAAYSEHLHIVQFLLEVDKTINVNQALISAARGGAFDIVKFLIEEKGANNLDQAFVEALDDGYPERSLRIRRYLVVERGVVSTVEL